MSTVESLTNLLQLVDVLCLLDVELKDIQDTSEKVQRKCSDSLRGENLSDNTIGVFKLDGSQKLSFDV